MCLQLPGTPTEEPDAAVDYSGTGSSAAGSDGSNAGSGGSPAGAGGRDGASGAGGLDEVPAIGEIDPGPQHVSQSCDDFSTGAVHVLGGPLGHRSVMEITLTNSRHEACEKLPDQFTRPWIRQTDGKLFYLLGGRIRQFVPDQAGAAGSTAVDQLANDPVVDVRNSCAPNPTPGFGPFSKLLLKPDGGIVYGCVAESQYDAKMYDDTGAVLGKWISDGLSIVDNAGKFLNVVPFALAYEQRNLYVYDHGLEIALVPIGRDAECFEESRIIALRALDRGFLVVLVNWCGLQLWQTSGNAINIVAYYAHAPNDKYQDSDPGFGNLAADGTLYYANKICTTNVDCLTCDVDFCAVKPSANRSATVEILRAYPVDGPPTHSGSMLLETWSDLGL